MARGGAQNRRRGWGKNHDRLEGGTQGPVTVAKGGGASPSQWCIFTLELMIVFQFSHHHISLSTEGMWNT